MNGVYRTRVGYAGGTTKNPTYYTIGDHSETIRIEFDPKVITYEELLDIFWESHSPAARPYSNQYMSIIFYHGSEQKRLAEQSLRKIQREIGKPVITRVEPAGIFTTAEEYHQKYYLKNDPLLMKDLRRYYPDPNDLTDSTAAARINGYIGRYGTPEEMENEVASLGLSREGVERLVKSMVPGNSGDYRGLVTRVLNVCGFTVN